MIVTIDLSEFNNKINRFNYLLGVTLSQLFQSYLSEEKREYPRKTKRQYGKGITGKIARSPRDVIDSKRLYNSFIWSNYIRGNILCNDFNYDAEYAILIYMGWTSSTGLTIPSYPWMNLAIRNINWDNLLKELWNQA